MAIDVKKVQNWLATKAPNLKCPSCGGKDFAAEQIVGAAIVGPDNGLSLGGPHVPELLVVCSNCGHIIHFSATMIGVSP